MNCNLFEVYLLLFIPVFTFSQQTKRATIKETYTIQKLGFIDKCEIYIPIIEDYEAHQKVIKMEYSKKPKYSTYDFDAKRAMYELNSQDLEVIKTIEISYIIELNKFDLTEAKKQNNNVGLKKGEKKTYLTNTGFYKIDKDNFDSSYVLKDINTIEKIKTINDFVVNQFSYVTFFGEDKGANYAIKNKTGDCTEYSDLMVALCRVNQIPARRVSGYSINSDTVSVLNRIFKSSGHAWVEVFLEEHGWVPFDPTYCDAGDNIDFATLPNQLVYLRRSEGGKGFNW